MTKPNEKQREFTVRLTSVVDHAFCESNLQDCLAEISSVIGTQPTQEKLVELTAYHWHVKAHGNEVFDALSKNQMIADFFVKSKTYITYNYLATPPKFKIRQHTDVLPKKNVGVFGKVKVHSPMPSYMNIPAYGKRDAYRRV